MSTSTITSETLLAQLHWRAAIKKFDSAKKIPAATWQTLEQALVLSPSSYGLQPWKFFVVTDAALRATLQQHSWSQSQITDASHLVVLARRTDMTSQDVDKYVDRIAEVRSVPKAALDGYRSMMLGSISGKSPDELGNWNARQVYIALGGFLTCCAMLGVDACPMEGFDSTKYDEILGLHAQGYSATVVTTAGYRASDDPYTKSAKVRYRHGDMVQHV